ncbi:MAG: hypothetical protein IKW03_06035 [Clostridia bacterium]|nr:hypothetical protein [Clostridia bacterium]
MNKFFRSFTAAFIVAIILISTYIPVFATERETTTLAETNTTELSTESTTKEPEKTYEKGDVNLSGSITAADARIILKASSQLEELDAQKKDLADYNSDGKVTAADARYVLRVSAKLDPFAEPKPTPETTTKPPETTTQKPITDAERKFTVATSDLFSTSYARYACLYDYDNDKILYGKNMHSPCHPASTTKVVTATLACEYLKPDDILTVGSELNLVHWNTSRSGLYQGQRIKFKEILKCLLVPSGCDAAYTIAVHAARKATGNYNLSASQALNKFVSMMNTYAKSLGMNDSHFMNPDGFPHYNHYVSAYDMVIMTTKAYSFKLIRDVVSQPWATAYFESGGSYSYSNSNETINPYSDRYYPYMVGMKTGSHSQAGQCLVTVAKKQIEKTGKTKTFVAVVYNCPSKYGRYSDLKSLYNTAFSYFWRQP